MRIDGSSVVSPGSAQQPETNTPAARGPAQAEESAFEPGAGRQDGWNRFQGVAGQGPLPPGDGPNDPDNPFVHRRPPPPPPTVTLPEPEQSSHDPYQVVSDPYTHAPLPIFDGTTDLGREVYQGTVGDCWLAAGVSEIAEKRPDLIRSLITDNGDGTVTVHLHHRVNGKLTPVDVRIDEELPANHVGGWYLLPYGSTALGANSKSIWWPLIEKAYAKMVGGYDKLPAWPNDNAANGLEAITGKPATGFGFSSDPTRLARDLQAKLASGKMVVVGTPDTSWMENHGIVPFHVYSVYGAGVDAQGPYVLLRNPWGVFEPGDKGGNAGNARDGTDDGFFRMPASEFLKYFTGGDYVDPPPAPPAPPAPPSSGGNWHGRIA